MILHDEPPAGFESGWALLNTLPSKVCDDLRSPCVDPENTFPAVVNGEPCVVIEQEFQASESGEDWPETGVEVIARLTRSLMPRLQRLGVAEHSFSGVVADTRVTFCGLPTLYLAVPAESMRPAQVRKCLSTFKAFAYPALKAA